MVPTIMPMAHDLNLQVIAEDVKTQAPQDFLALPKFEIRLTSA